ncbi:pyridoxal kinase PdxY [Nostocoides sp. HKS02]|uniref:pyridoxal kinase PdxY n=1 Tax=Nostocoides sp. HKS02 TaxID=1813880 RepID=UPI0012B46F2B|nr:pyridoxal kinase PdxY [Tetrasphaera sp. HKS02]QGN57747.1 pyridoxal kinase PdxY [Tetrasphaera sp. HKS02]
MSILSIQSTVAYGHVGNSAAVFPLQRLGLEVWPVATVHFSNHTGYGQWRGPLLAAEEVREVLTGIEERGVLGRCTAVLSGYQGAEDVGAVVLDAVARVKAVNPGAVYCCDPVLGDTGRGFFVRPGIPEFMRDHVIPAADIATPNHFELDYLTGRGERTTTMAGVLEAVEDLRAMGPRTVLVTSLVHDGMGEDTLELLAVDDSGAWLVSTPLLPVSVNGAGDLTAALFLAHLLDTGSTAMALGRTSSSVWAVLAETARSGEREIQIVAAQEAIAHPDERFAVQVLR